MRNNNFKNGVDEDFKFDLLSLFWQDSMPEELDLCAHGKVFLQIGDEIICDGDTFDITVSSTALHMMRTLSENYKKDDFASQLLPCCGFNFFADSADDDYVNILGCPSGIDWEIIHLENNVVKFITENGTEAEIKLEKYKHIVLEFAEKIEKFYKDSKPKIIEENQDFNIKGYPAFWNEWHLLRNKWK